MKEVLKYVGVFAGAVTFFYAVALPIHTKNIELSLEIAKNKMSSLKEENNVLHSSISKLKEKDSRTILTMQKIENRGISLNRCIQLAKEAFQLSLYNDIQVQGVYVYGWYEDSEGMKNNAGINCGSQNPDDYVNVSIVISGRRGLATETDKIRRHFYENTELVQITLTK